MKARGHIQLSRLYAVAKAHLGRSLQQGESPVDVVADMLVAAGIERPINTNARKFVEANRASVFGAKAVRSKSAKALLPQEATNAFLHSFEWRRVRMLAIKKYGNRCQCCGASPATGAVINVDHIKPRKLFPDLALTLENLQVLCHECNHGKGNWDMTDWREQAKQDA